MNTKLVCLVLGFFLFSQSGQAQSPFPPLTADQRDNLAVVYARCAAYFTYAWKGLARSGQTDLANAHQEFAKSAMANSYKLAAVGRTQEMALKVVEARYKLSLEAMSADIGSDFSNISVIVNKYGKSCVQAVSDSPEFARQYIQNGNESKRQQGTPDVQPR